jgi:hypothetical protein
MADLPQLLAEHLFGSSVMRLLSVEANPVYLSMIYTVSMADSPQLLAEHLFGSSVVHLLSVEANPVSIYR